jgi:cytochrome P450
LTVFGYQAGQVHDLETFLSELTLPPQTTCGVPHFTAGHWEYNFTDPDQFVPERWLPEERDARYANDKRDAFRPFAKGSLDCIGKR